MLKSENQGMQTFDTALYRLYESGQITEEEELKNADSKNNLALKIRLTKDKGGKASEPSSDISIEPKEEPKNEAVKNETPKTVQPTRTAPPATPSTKPQPTNSPGLSLEPMDDKDDQIVTGKASYNIDTDPVDKNSS